MSSPDTALPSKAVQLKSFDTASQIFQARFTPCGTTLLAACMDASVRRWTLVEPPPAAPAPDPLADAEPAKAAPPKKPVRAAKPPPPPPYELRELEPLTGFQGWVHSVALHPTKPATFAADTWGKLESWNSLEEKARRNWSVPEAHDGWIRQIALSHDGSQILTCGLDRWVRLWDAETGRKLAELQHPQPVYALAFHPAGGECVFSDVRGDIHVASLAPFKTVRTISAPDFFLLARMQEVSGLRQLRFSDQGATLLAVGAKPSTGGFVEATPMLVRLEFSSGKVLDTVKIGAPKDGFMLDLDWHPKGFHAVALSGQPGTGRLVLLKAGDKEPFFSDPSPANCQSVTLHPRGDLLVVVATNKNSSGNGKPVSKDGEYQPNSSPLLLYRLEA